MSQQRDETDRQRLIKSEYEPVSSSRKLNLLLQRSVRYSYRQRCCNCCPTILCELLFPFVIIVILLLSRYGINQLDAEIKKNGGNVPGPLDQRPCSQNLTTPPTSSNDLFKKCFKFPPRYGSRGWGSVDPEPVSSRTNIVFEPIRDDIDEIVALANARLDTMGCATANASTRNPNEETDADLLRNSTVNTVIVDLTGTTDLKTDRKLVYNIIVRTPNAILKNDPIDTSFIYYEHPSIIGDRTNATDSNQREGSELPEFTDVKMFVDSLLMEYQSNRSIQYQIERNLMACAPYRDDYLFTSRSNFISIIKILIDAIFMVPYLVLLTSLIREKNAKVKEILKVLGIEPILNNFAQAIRTMIIYLLLILLLCISYKLKLKPYAYFDTVNFGTLFLGNLIFSVQLVSFCIMNAQIFNSNVRAVIFTFIIYYIANYTFSYVILWPVSIQYLLMFLCPYYAAPSLLQQAVLHDLANKDVALFRTIYRHVPMYFPTLIVLLFSSLFFWILSWYLEKVFPGEFGIPMEWNFLFKREYWRRSATKTEDYAYDNRASTISRSSAPPPLARTNSRGTAVVHVDHLVKKFGPDKIAVNEVSFDLYENQITSLLGPNGSGKTTIFNCLIGIYKQTSGSITMANEYGVDCDTRQNIDFLRKSIGYCPQHDILFDLLTIEEQIQFYAAARGFGKNKKQISDEMLRLVSLDKSKTAYCNSLSGGMKRRLSLACAFVGDTRIILLDEPSSGLDPSNRRLLWDWLRTMKEGKTLLLTTHFMEESDALSDRIMIISNGVIKADGTSAKLKEDFGSGYKLVINKQAHFPTNQIESELRTSLPFINVESDVPGDGDVVFRTNQQPDEQFIQALRQLEAMKAKDLIKNYGVQNSTMDDVFMKITRDAKNDNEPGATAVDIERIDEQCQHVFSHVEFYHGFHYYLSQLHGLLMKTLLVRYRRWGLTLVVLLLPILYNLISNITSRNQNATGTFKMQVNLLNPQTILYAVDPSIENFFRAAVQSNDITLEKRSEDIPALNQYIREKRIDRPYTFTDIYLAFEVSAPQGDEYKVQTLSSNLINGYEIISVASDMIYKHAVNDVSASIQTTLIYKRTGNFTIEPSISGALNLLSIASCFLKLLPTSLLLDVIVFYLIFLYTAVFLASERKDSFLSLLNISGLHPAFYWLFNYVFDLITTVFWFCYLLAVFCIFDVAFNGSPNSRSTTPGTIPIEFATPWDIRVQFYPLSIIIALPTLPFVYLITKIFKSDILCGLAVLFLLFIIHLVSIIVPIVMAVIQNNFLQLLLYWILNVISPSINAQVIITYILAQKSDFCKVFSIIDIPFLNKIGDDTIGLNWVILLFHIVLLLLLLIVIDTGLLRLPNRSSSIPSNFDESTLDDDVRTERNRVLNSNPSGKQNNYVNADDYNRENETDHLTVHDLVKRYPARSVLAVNHLTFGAKRGEAFGLLGYNGAGKTTTFRMLIGDETATQGTAYIDGQNIARRFRSIRRLGYCPQADCSMDFLTVRDGLYLLARIRGVVVPRIHSIVQIISSLFLLDPFLNNYIHQLSGGTKRRLHAALALIGPPMVAILDEPTTGVDPNARQQMQEIFANAVKAKLTIILTSHSMDECERVCNRLGIMFNGQLVCLGTIQHLKSKFGHGYTVEIKVRSNPNDTNGAAMQNVKTFLLSNQQYNIQPREMSHSTGSFQIQQGTPAELFQLLEQNKQALNIETYTISQTTLEQIFLAFGKQMNAL